VGLLPNRPLAILNKSQVELSFRGRQAEESEGIAARASFTMSSDVSLTLNMTGPAQYVVTGLF
jgi:hypothetical protein